MYQYVFFDLDGTITEPEEGIINGVLYALSRFGITVENRTSLYPYIGPPLRDSFREFHGLSEEEAEQAVLYYREYYSTKGIYQNGIMPGMEAAFQTLQERGCHLYVATSKPELYAKQILEHLKLDGYFDIIAGSTFDKSRDTKAAVIEYLLAGIAADQGKPSMDDIIMVGDREFDVIGARAFGIEIADDSHLPAAAFICGMNRKRIIHRTDRNLNQGQIVSSLKPCAISRPGDENRAACVQCLLNIFILIVDLAIYQQIADIGGRKCFDHALCEGIKLGISQKTDFVLRNVRHT